MLRPQPVGFREIVSRQRAAAAGARASASPPPPTRAPTPKLDKGVTLDPDQKRAFEFLVDAVQSRRPHVSMGGLAGTGKSFLLNLLVRCLKHDLKLRVATCAFTGKAASVLRRKGVEDARTVHSLIYKPHQRLTKGDESCTVPENQDEIDRLFKEGWRGELSFSRLPNIDYDVLVCDEGSTIGEQLWADLIWFKIPIVVVGDHGQLPPVGGKMINLMENPDVRLERIHRYAGEIAKFAHFLREGGRPHAWASETGAVRIIGDDDEEQQAALAGADQVICGFNRTRVDLNGNIRKWLGREGSEPQVGDRVVCLRNSKPHGLFNGLQGVVERVHTRMRRGVLVDLATDDGPREGVSMALDAFNVERLDKGYMPPLGTIPFDFAYAQTVYKCQGDQFRRTCVVEEHSRRLWEPTQANYTAATRTEEQVSWIPE